MNSTLWALENLEEVAKSEGIDIQEQINSIKQWLRKNTTHNTTTQTDTVTTL